MRPSFAAMFMRLCGQFHTERSPRQALYNAPNGSNLPCHRVVNSAGRTAPHYTRQRKLLEKEDVTFFAQRLCRFKETPAY